MERPWKHRDDLIGRETQRPGWTQTAMAQLKPGRRPLEGAAMACTSLGWPVWHYNKTEWL